MDNWEDIQLLPVQQTPLRDPPNPRHKQRDTPTPPDVFVERPGIIYSQYLILLISIVALSLWFCFTARFATGGTRAPSSLAEFAISKPHLTTQIVTIIASTLTATVDWALGGAAVLFAKKRLRRSRSIFEVEVLSGISVGGVVWDWKWRPVSMLATMIIVFIGFFITSGFVALLAPFPIAKRINFSMGAAGEVDANVTSNVGGEFDFNSQLPACSQWLGRTSNQIWCPHGEGNCGTCERAIRYPNSSFVYTPCSNQIDETLSAARSAMLYRFAPAIPKERESNLISSFTQLANTRIIGTTSGTLPIGPWGVRALSASTFPVISDLTSSFNYTLQLQGIWGLTSCTYIDRSQSKISMDPDRGVKLSYNVTCPAGSRPLLPMGSLRNDTKTRGLILAAACIQTSDNITIHLRSFVDAQDYDNQITQPTIQLSDSHRPVVTARSNDEVEPEIIPLGGWRRQSRRAYSGIDAMECFIAPRLGPVDAEYQTKLAAFNMTPSTSDYVPLSQLGSIGFDLTREALYQTINTIGIGQTTMAGNALGRLIRSVAISYAKLDGESQGSEIAQLVADALKGIFDYQITHLRLIFNAANPEPMCRIPVTGTLVEQSIGWHTGSQVPTIIALLPMIITCFGSAGVILWVMRMRGRLTKFDPTNAVCLIAATSVGEVEILDGHHKLHPTIIGNPEDEIVRSTEVRYQFDKRRWGLRSH